VITFPDGERNGLCPTKAKPMQRDAQCEFIIGEMRKNAAERVRVSLHEFSGHDMFQPGNPGRPRGSRNKLGEAFIAALAEDFEKHGVEVIERVRIEKPEAYIKVVASLLPKDLNLNVNSLDHLTDAQLIARLRSLTKEAAPLLANLDGDDETEAARH
jgi:hypothetical protein